MTRNFWRLASAVPRGCKQKQLSHIVSFHAFSKCDWGLKSQALCVSNPIIAPTIVNNYIYSDHAMEETNESLNGNKPEISHETLAHELKVMTDAIDIHLLHFDRNSRILFVNRATEDFWHLSRDQMIGRTIPEIIGEKDYEPIKHYSDRALKGETVSYESSFVDPSGSTVMPCRVK